MSTTAVSDGACYQQSQETILVKRALMDAAAKRVLLLDHTKFRRQALHQLAPLTAFDVVIVDADVAPDELEALRELGVRTLVAERGAARGAEPLPGEGLGRAP
jgi:DeoR/GlpR family transcriptional regulator of sugar metabolism